MAAFEVVVAQERAEVALDLGGVMYQAWRPATRKHTSSSVRVMRSTKPLVRGVAPLVVGCTMPSIPPYFDFHW